MLCCLLSWMWLFLPGLLLYVVLCLWVRWRSKYLLPHLQQEVGQEEVKPVKIGFFHPYCNAGVEVRESSGRPSVHCRIGEKNV